MNDQEKDKADESVSQEGAASTEVNTGAGLSRIAEIKAEGIKADARIAALKAENDRKEMLMAEEALAGTGGGQVEQKILSPETQKVKNAKEMFKGTGLSDAIEKANE